MPSAYTCDLYEDKPITFKEFVLTCSRAFGATLDQHDDPPDAPRRLPGARTQYYDEAQAAAEADLDRYRGASYELINEWALDDHEAALARWREVDQKRRDVEGRYRDMLAQVIGWLPPTNDHYALKEFMVDQLKESIRFDCSVVEPPVRLTVDEYRESRVAAATSSIKHYTKQRSEEIKSTDQRRNWITTLAKSLGASIENDEVVPP